MRNAIRYRRFLALICAMILVALTVAGCGQKTEPAQETEAASTEESEEEINVEEIVEASSEMATLDTEGSGAFLGAFSVQLPPASMEKLLLLNLKGITILTLINLF